MAGIPGLSGPSAQTKDYQNQTSGMYGAIRNTGNTLTQMGQQAQGRYNTYRPQADSALSGYSSLLQRRAGNQDRAAVMSGALGDTAANYQAGQAALTQQMQARGLSPDSSASVGGLAALEGMRGQAMGQAATAARQYGQERQLANAQNLYNLLYGEAQGANANASQFYNQGLGAYNSAAQGYGNLAAQSAAADAARGQQLMGLISTAAGAYGMLGGQAMPTAPTYAGGGRAPMSDFNASVGYDHSLSLPTLAQSEDLTAANFTPTLQGISPVIPPTRSLRNAVQYGFGGRP